MHSQTFLILALGAIAQARLGQEQVPIPAISALTEGSPGVAATLAGNDVSFLLAAADPCAKLSAADKIITELGTSDDVLAAAKGLVAAEMNTQAGANPKICTDASLPATQSLRGITPLIDPALDGAATQNANSKTSLTDPFPDAGLSVADIMAANGFTDIANAAKIRRQRRSPFLRERAALDLGTCTDPTIDFGLQDRQEESFQANNLKDFNHGSALAIGVIANFICGQLGSACKAGSDATAACAEATSAASGKTGQAAADAFNAIMSPNSTLKERAIERRANGTLAGADFGKCTPTMDFVAGRPGRKATEFTFQATNPLIATGQQDALNPAIIANRICDQLTNVCGANDVAKAACTSAQAGATAKVQATADTFNAALGF